MHAALLLLRKLRLCGCILHARCLIKSVRSFILLFERVYELKYPRFDDTLMIDTS